MDRSIGRCLSSKLVNPQNTPFPITSDCNDWNALNEKSITPVSSKRPIHKSFTSNGMEFSSVDFLTTWLVGEGDLRPKLMKYSKPDASKDDEMREYVLEDWREWVYQKQPAPNRIPLDSKWGISTSINDSMTTLQNHRTNMPKIVYISCEASQWGKICG